MLLVPNNVVDGNEKQIIYFNLWTHYGLLMRIQIFLFWVARVGFLGKSGLMVIFKSLFWNIISFWDAI
jgi:hypothetical protein